MNGQSEIERMMGLSSHSDFGTGNILHVKLPRTSSKGVRDFYVQLDSPETTFTPSVKQELAHMALTPI